MFIVDPRARPTAAPLPCPLLAFQILLERPQYLLIIAVSDGRRSSSSIPKGAVVAVVVSVLVAGGATLAPLGKLDLAPAPTLCTVVVGYCFIPDKNSVVAFCRHTI